MSSSKSTAQLVRRCRDGDAQAESELYSRYSEKICRHAEKRIAGYLKPRISGEDIVQTVFRTFFRNARNGAFVIDDSSDFWRLILKITLHKIADAAQLHAAGKRNAQLDSPLSDEEADVLVSQEPGPDEAAILAEVIESILGDCDPFECQVLQLRVNCYRVNEIARELGRSRSAVSRALQRARHKATSRFS